MDQLTIDKCIFKQVTRRKTAICNVCNEIINIKDQALIVYSDDWSGIPIVVAVIHLTCKKNFKFDYNKNLPINLRNK